MHGEAPSNVSCPTGTVLLSKTGESHPVPSDGGQSAAPYQCIKYETYRPGLVLPGAVIRDYMTCETITGTGDWMDTWLLLDGPYIQDGFVRVFGVELNPDVLKAHLAWRNLGGVRARRIKKSRPVRVPGRLFNFYLLDWFSTASSSFYY
jgi:hypothetical protein